MCGGESHRVPGFWEGSRVSSLTEVGTLKNESAWVRSCCGYSSRSLWDTHRACSLLMEHSRTSPVDIHRYHLILRTPARPYCLAASGKREELREASFSFLVVAKNRASWFHSRTSLSTHPRCGGKENVCLPPSSSQVPRSPGPQPPAPPLALDTPVWSSVPSPAGPGTR